ncbi:hypothetical protein GGS20DRAFT_593728 [Poronia punctata]|nr:hypothetical protein GGS20DRAFT_593728 [Poronia punctata]
MHKSFFSYNITRPYPYKWFTPVVIVGGLVEVALVSFINYGISGYELATCASVTFPLNALVYTRNGALPYTLSSVWRETNGSRSFLGSLIYYNNNHLLDCNITQVDIETLGKYNARPTLVARAKVNVRLRSYATCAVDIDTAISDLDNSSGRTYFEMIGAYQDGETNFLSEDSVSLPSLHWGRSIMHVYWKLLFKAWYDSALAVENVDYGGEITLTRPLNQEPNGTAEEVTSENPFHVDCFTEFEFCANHTIPELLTGYGGPYPNIWHIVDTLGKAMWFPTMTDLGYNTSITKYPNMLAYPNLLESLTSNFTNAVEAYETDQKTPHPDRSFGLTLGFGNSSLERKSFNASTTLDTRLGARPSYLSTNYVCQVPRPKSAGVLVFSILIADLVLLQAIWTIFKFTVDTVAERRHPSRGCCRGCQQPEHDGSDADMPFRVHQNDSLLQLVDIPECNEQQHYGGSPRAEHVQILSK